MTSACFCCLFVCAQSLSLFYFWILNWLSRYSTNVWHNQKDTLDAWARIWFLFTKRHRWIYTTKNPWKCVDTIISNNTWCSLILTVMSQWLQVQGVTDFAWSPTQNVFAYFVPEEVCACLCVCVTNVQTVFAMILSHSVYVPIARCRARVRLVPQSSNGRRETFCDKKICSALAR